jgi:hypothetical protein
VCYDAATDQTTGPKQLRGPHAGNKRRVPPSEGMRQRIDQLLNNGMKSEGVVLGAWVRLGAQLMMQEGLERETTERPGRVHGRAYAPAAHLAHQRGPCR